MRYYFDVTRSRSPLLDNSVHCEIVTRHWYDNVTWALNDQIRMTKELVGVDVSGVAAVSEFPADPSVRPVTQSASR